MSSIIQWMQDNPGTTFFSIALIAVIIAIIILVVNRKPKSEDDESSEPSITITSLSSVYNPIESDDTVEAYVSGGIEYNEGIVKTFGKNIDIKITWKNGAGFSRKKVIALVFERLIGTKVVDTKELTDVNSIKDFGGGTTIFNGDDLSDADAANVGSSDGNIIKIYYKTLTVEKKEIISNSNNPIIIPQEKIDNIPKLTNVSETPIPPTIFRDVLTTSFITDSFTYINLQSRLQGFRKNVRIKPVPNKSNFVTFITPTGDFELVTGKTEYKIEKYLDDEYVIKILDGNTEKFVIWDGTNIGTTDSIFSSSTELAKATWIIDTIKRKRSTYIQSASYKCNNHGAVDVTNWFKEYIDNNEPGERLDQYLCSTGGKYDGKCVAGAYPGAHNAFSDANLYQVAKEAGSKGDFCNSQYHAVTIKGVNGATFVWSWGTFLDMSGILTNRVAPSMYIKSAKYKCNYHSEVDVTGWFKKFVDSHRGSGDLTKYLCGPGGKYDGKCVAGAYPGSHSVFSDSNLYDAAKNAGDGNGVCNSQWHAVIITGVNGATTTWSWGTFLDMSRILTVEIPASSYIKSATYKCGGYASVDLTNWFKKFVDDHSGSTDKSKYLCGPGGKYTSTCVAGAYPGSHTVFGDSGLYQAAKEAGDTSGTCDRTFHALTITGMNDASFVWSWGSYLNLSSILSGDPLPGDFRNLLNNVINAENIMKTYV